MGSEPDWVPLDYFPCGQPSIVQGRFRRQRVDIGVHKPHDGPFQVRVLKYPTPGYRRVFYFNRGFESYAEAHNTGLAALRGNAPKSPVPPEMWPREYELGLLVRRNGRADRLPVRTLLEEVTDPEKTVLKTVHTICELERVGPGAITLLRMHEWGVRLPRPGRGFDLVAPARELDLSERSVARIFMRAWEAAVRKSWNLDTEHHGRAYTKHQFPAEPFPISTDVDPDCSLAFLRPVVRGDGLLSVDGLAVLRFPFKEKAVLLGFGPDLTAGPGGYWTQATVVPEDDLPRQNPDAPSIGHVFAL